MDGYTNKILDVDLTTLKTKKTSLSDDLLRAYIGGRGLAVKLVWDALPSAQIDPLSPDNLLAFTGGPFTGLPVTGASRTSIVAKSPATSAKAKIQNASTLAIEQMPGHFAVELKYAGYDALLIRGKAAFPTALVIKDDEVELRQVPELWGKEVNETETLLRKTLPNEPYQIAAIGPAGENLVSYASIVHTQPFASHAARGGLGAVMGSKNLKAIAVRGLSHPFEVAKTEEFDKLSRESYTRLQSWNQYETWRRWGTACLAEAGSDSGILATKNFREGTFEKISQIGAVKSSETHWIRSEGCFYCPLHCRKIALLRNANGQGKAVAGPDLETIAMLGSNCAVSSLDGILEVKDRCDNLGLDPSSSGNILGFLMEAVEKGLLSPPDIDGVDLRWGNWKAMVAALNNIVNNKSWRNQLGKGVREIANQIGNGSRAWAMETKGLEMDTYNIPALPAMAIVYGTNSVGGVHQMGHSPQVQNNRAITDSLGMCRFHAYANTVNELAPILSAVTGEKWTPESLAIAGERIWNLERAFISREGFSAEDDVLPLRPKTDAFTVGPKKGAVLEDAKEKEMLSDYYKSRGWDAKTAAPQEDLLNKLGLEDAASALKAG